MNESPIPQNPSELLAFRRDFSDLNVRLSVLEESVRWIKENMQKNDGFGRQILLVLLASVPGMLSLAAIGFLYINGVIGH